MYQCKTKPEELCLCFVKIADTLRCKCGAQSCTSLAIQHLPLYSGDDYTAPLNAGNLSGCLCDSADQVINIPCLKM